MNLFLILTYALSTIETGYGGAPYEKLTSDAMCDELGNIDNMRKYVEDYGAKICVIATGGAYCSGKDHSNIMQLRISLLMFLKDCNTRIMCVCLFLCTESQVKYAEEWKSKDATKVVSEFKHLEIKKKLLSRGDKMKPDVLDWVIKRIAVLKQYPFAPPEVWTTRFLHFFLFPQC